MKKIRVIDFFHYLCKRYHFRSRRVEAWRVSFIGFCAEKELRVGLGIAT